MTEEQEIVAQEIIARHMHDKDYSFTKIYPLMSLAEMDEPPGHWTEVIVSYESRLILARQGSDVSFVRCPVQDASSLQSLARRHALSS